jgi:2-polyprenyl-6-hydroxyphenyl methylase/3-demethylubiquinone-9 3-methyltransferase
MKLPKNVDAREIDKFNRVAKTWWDPRGEMGTLHTINPLRARFILERLPSSGLRLLDVGCGGGILAEALAQAGARVTGIDLSEDSLQAARLHARSSGLAIDYLAESAESLAERQPDSFDAVTCMEMLEHVPDPARIVAACARALKPGGQAFFSSINRTPKAFLFAIVGGEYLLRLLPRGSHQYNRLIRPAELQTWARSAGLEFVRLASLMYNPFTRRFSVAPGREDVNYMLHFVKPL